MSTNLFDATEWISQAEAARLRGVSRQAIAALVRKNRIPVLNVGGRLLVQKKAVEDFAPGSPGRKPK